MKCAGCGQEVEQVRGEAGRWGHRLAEPRIGSAAWDMCCRVEYDPPDLSRILAADYHYVEGETQKHYRAKPERVKRR